jgi:hypothetical protein
MLHFFLHTVCTATVVVELTCGELFSLSQVAIPYGPCKSPLMRGYEFVIYSAVYCHNDGKGPSDHYGMHRILSIL